MAKNTAVSTRISEYMKPYLERPVYAGLFFLTPAFHWYTYNYLKEELPFLVLPLLMVSSLALFFIVQLSTHWLFLYFVKSQDIGALNYLFFGIWFFTFGRIREYYAELGIISGVIRTWELALIGISVLLILFLCSLFLPKKLPKLNQFLNVIVIGVLLINLGLMIKNVLTVFFRDESPKFEIKIPLANYKTPDIYYLIFDEFANPETMKTFFHMDMSHFEQTLKNLGFYMAKNSHSIYPRTKESLGSTMGLGFESYENANLNESILSKIVKALGYKYVHAGSMQYPSPAYAFLRYNKYADINYHYSLLNGAPSRISLIVGPAMKMAETTPITYFPLLCQKVPLCHNHLNIQKNSIIGIFEYLRNTAPTIKKKFVFAHIYSPHRPYDFYKTPIIKKAGQNRKLHPMTEQYLGQYEYITHEMLRLVMSILEKEKTPPVIILQSDHGYKSPGFVASDLKRIFNAIYIPNGDTVNFRDDMNPIDTLKIIFKDYIGLDIDQLMKTQKWIEP